MGSPAPTAAKLPPAMAHSNHGHYTVLFQTRPTWLGGTPRPENITARDYVSGQLFQRLGSVFKNFEESFTSVSSLITSAHGIVIEVGPGIGSQLDRFDISKIEHIYGVELNPAFVPAIRAEVEKTQLQGKYTVIQGAVEDERLLAEFGVMRGSVDSIVCIGTLCSVDNPEKVMRWMYELLKPGGVFIFWEHRLSRDFLTRLVQGFWNPVWRYFMGGCSLTRRTGDIIRDAGDWDNVAQGEDIQMQTSSAVEWTIMPRVEGQWIKRVKP
ncbi:S-adenosyl-L-methionine-dependent methyltransferase [Amniculicola lignicola CBS 123094]|uniref:S-adenosyl-L-methionine-dependent methyltransferase n=1 Tax=Amniculicola lignicola CBS 123094 TaxID=1392246 RepID=A0A6A5VXB7_9PLEO|nr:S-adenosyl-L-methionine-dependent methyltransferase [Amniculicola lignicola CBS 123094]